MLVNAIDRKQHVEADGREQNKDKPKKGHLPQDMMDERRYLAAHTVSDVWICYPWEATYVISFLLLLRHTRADFMAVK